VLAAGGTYTGLNVELGGSFTPNGKTISTLNSGTDTLTVQGSCTVSGAVTIQSGKTLLLASGITLTCGSLVSPGSGANGTLRAVTAGSAATISDSSGSNQVNRMTLKDLSFTGGATWTGGPGTVSEGNVTGIALQSPGLFPLELF
jgi:hypothetical protein